VRYVVTVAGGEVVVEVDGTEVRVDGEIVDASIEGDVASGRVVLTLDGTRHPLRVSPRDARGTYNIGSAGWSVPVEALDERRRAIQALMRATARPTGPTPLIAPMPGLIVRVHVRPGDVVAAGQPLVVMEAMKMENELRATAAGVVRSVAVQPGAAVEKGTVLVALDAPEVDGA
jgi:pyruvate carboxylase subunit B